MPAPKRAAVYVAGLAGAGVALIVAERSAESRPTTVWDLLQGCGDRVVELEAEVQRLRAELRQLRSPGGRHVRRFPGEGEVCISSSAAGGDTQCVTVPECSVPFDVSPAGVKRFKPECLQALEALPVCELPYEFDARGVKSFKRSCL